MSGDLGPRVAISASKKFLQSYPDVDLVVFGDTQELGRFLPKKPKDLQRISLIHCDEKVEMADDPLVALRQKKQSSMWKAVESLVDADIAACVSAGNTGALLAIGRYLLKTFEGIDRPAICKSMPVKKGYTLMLDLGANISVGAEQLYQFALMGSVLASLEVDNPSIALLNIGSESIKGTEEIQKAQQLISQDSELNYVGFIEANQIFLGEVNVIACDGFHGNIALKTSEGLAQLIGNKLKELFSGSVFGKVAALLIWPLLTKLRKEMDPALYNGASFLGLKKVLVKSHGNANKKAFYHALVVAYEQAKNETPSKIEAALIQHKL